MSRDEPFAVRSIADVPWPGTRFERGEPVMTILAAGGPDGVPAALARLERMWRWRLGLVSDDGNDRS